MSHEIINELEKLIRRVLLHLRDVVERNEELEKELLQYQSKQIEAERALLDTLKRDQENISNGEF